MGTQTTKHNKTKQSKQTTKQNKAKQRKTKQNKTNQNKQCLLCSTAEATHLPLCYALTSSDLGRGHCGQIPYSHAYNDLAKAKGELLTNFLISSFQGGQ